MTLTCDIHRWGSDQNPSVCFHTVLHHCFLTDFLLFLCRVSPAAYGSRIGVESELELPAVAITTATQDPRCICHLHHSLWQRRIFDPLSEARDQTRISDPISGP